MTSPDAPAREYHKEREVIMWLVGNIPENDIENGTSIADYVGMVPFYVEGLHRYIYFVYEQEDAGEIDFLYDEVFLTSKEPVLLRAYHDSEEFRQTHELGSIIATNFFYMNNEK
nr:PREDICTED: phosphatidylethanolamine-binding protein 1-like [Bemisia tabaci]